MVLCQKWQKKRKFLINVSASDVTSLQWYSVVLSIQEVTKVTITVNPIQTEAIQSMVMDGGGVRMHTVWLYEEIYILIWLVFQVFMLQLMCGMYNVFYCFVLMCLCVNVL